MRFSTLLSVEAVLLGGLGAIALGICLLLVGRRWRARHGNRAALVVLLGLLAAAGLVALTHSAGLALLPLGLAGLWLLGWVGRSNFAQACLRRATTLPGNHHAQACLLVLVGFGSLYGWVALQNAEVPDWSEEEQKQACDIFPPMKAMPQPARTDRGNPIQLNVPTQRDPAYVSAETEEQYLSERGMPEKVIRTAPFSLDSNCHGWAFTGGRYWISSNDVDRILDDNGYTLVSDPRPEDVVIYRVPSERRVLHTGVVTGVTLDGTVLVESKWGKMGRFIHRVEDQPYSHECQFYRSPRKGHLLRDLPGGPDAAPDSPSAGSSAL